MAMRSSQQPSNTPESPPDGSEASGGEGDDTGFWGWGLGFELYGVFK